jgi:hypothetical protein
VFGDVSLRNAVFALGPPRVLLLDCDGAASLSNPARQQPNTPFWFPPEIASGAQRLQDDRTDVFKLGLAVLRCMAPGKGATTATSPAGVANILDPEGARLVAQALGTDRGQRPSAKELYDYFYRAVSALVMPPAVASARLRNPHRIRGQDVRIDWQISNAATAFMISGGQRIQVDLAQHPSGFAFRPDQSGPVAVEVANRFGNLRLDLGDVSLYELPPFNVDFDFLPTPQIPALPALPTATLDRVLAGVPTTRFPQLPAVPDLGTFGLVESLMQNAALTVPLPQLGEAIVGATAAVTATLQAEADQIGTSVRTAYLANQRP